MGTITTVVTLLGLAIASGALILLGKAAAFTGGTTNVTLLSASIVGFLFGIFLFGWALGKRTQY